MDKVFIGPKLRQLRKHHKHTQAELGKTDRGQCGLCEPVGKQPTHPDGQGVDGLNGRLWH